MAWSLRRRLSWMDNFRILDHEVRPGYAFILRDELCYWELIEGFGKGPEFHDGKSTETEQGLPLTLGLSCATGRAKYAIILRVESCYRVYAARLKFELCY